MVICVVVEVWLSDKDMEPACSNASWEDSQHNWGTSEMARQPMTERDSYPPEELTLRKMESLLIWKGV